MPAASSFCPHLLDLKLFPVGEELLLAKALGGLELLDERLAGSAASQRDGGWVRCLRNLVVVKVAESEILGRRRGQDREGWGTRSSLPAVCERAKKQGRSGREGVGDEDIQRIRLSDEFQRKNWRGGQEGEGSYPHPQDDWPGPDNDAAPSLGEVLCDSPTVAAAALRGATVSTRARAARLNSFHECVLENQPVGDARDEGSLACEVNVES